MKKFDRRETFEKLFALEGRLFFGDDWESNKSLVNIERTLLAWAMKDHPLCIGYTETESMEQGMLTGMRSWKESGDSKTFDQFIRMYKKAAGFVKIKSRRDFDVCMSFIAAMGFSHPTEFRTLARETGIYMPFIINAEKMSEFEYLKPRAKKIKKMQEILTAHGENFPPLKQHVVDMLKYVYPKKKYEALKDLVTEFENRYSKDLGGFKSKSGNPGPRNNQVIFKGK